MSSTKNLTPSKPLHYAMRRHIHECRSPAASSPATKPVSTASKSGLIGLGLFVHFFVLAVNRARPATRRITKATKPLRTNESQPISNSCFGRPPNSSQQPDRGVFVSKIKMSKRTHYAVQTINKKRHNKLQNPTPNLANRRVPRRPPS